MIKARNDISKPHRYCGRIQNEPMDRLSNKYLKYIDVQIKNFN